MTALSLADIKELITFAKNHNVAELEICDGSLKFSLSSDKETVPFTQSYQSAPEAPVPNYSAENPFR